jgi:exodeoxyribonuclease III
VKIATWNVNSIRIRLPTLLDWLKQAAPDVVLLQETKVVDEGFPSLEIGDRGYNIAQNGQKTYNGVAILAKRPIQVETKQLPGDAEDVEARYIEAIVDGLRVASLYVPQGTDAAGPRFAFKLRYYQRLREHMRSLMAQEDPFVIGGDWNVAPEPDDVWDPAALDGTLCYHPDERRGFRTIMHLGVIDAVKALNAAPHQYSWWDYRGGSWPKNQGMRIDHLILSPQAADKLQASGIDRAPRAVEKASDHTPVWCELSP